MTYEFKVIMTKWHHNRGNFFFVRHLGDTHDFDIPEGSLFGDIPIYNYTEMQSLTGEHGIPQVDLFVFRPIFGEEWFSEIHFTEGQLVKLTIK